MPVTSLSSVNEGQTGYITLSFTDEAGVSITPSSFTYTLDDLVTRQNIASGTINAPSVPYKMELLASWNKIVTDGVTNEEHVLTIDASYEGSKHVTGDYHFNVTNLEFKIT